jgi:hypothetical protein
LIALTGLINDMQSDKVVSTNIRTATLLLNGKISEMEYETAAIITATKMANSDERHNSLPKRDCLA